VQPAWKRQAARALAALVLSAAAVRAEEAAKEDTRALLEKWVETKRLVSMEKQDWRVGRQLLEDRIDLVRREIESLREKAEQAKKDMGEGEEKLAELRGQNEELKAATAGLADVVARLEGRVQAFLAQAPEPIRERVKPLSQRIPRDAAATKMALSERFQNVIGILNEVNKFSREIAVASEVRDLPDGAKAEVTVFYLGLGQAYYCNLNGGIAGVGRPGEAGWAWEPDDGIAQAVADAIAVYRNEKPAAYVPLPVEVR
jgi:FtsZ-binding cell division protein ZapB